MANYAESADGLRAHTAPARTHSSVTQHDILRLSPRPPIIRLPSRVIGFLGVLGPIRHGQGRDIRRERARLTLENDLWHLQLQQDLHVDVPTTLRHKVEGGPHSAPPRPPPRAPTNG